MSLTEYETHQLLREKWVHEDNLIHHRLSWLLLSQSILFAGYAVLVTASGGFPQEDLSNDALIYAFPFLGLLTIALTLFSLYAAFAVQDQVKEVADKSIGDSGIRLFSSVEQIKRGRFVAQALPLVFMVVWFIIPFMSQFRS